MVATTPDFNESLARLTAHNRNLRLGGALLCSALLHVTVFGVPFLLADLTRKVPKETVFFVESRGYAPSRSLTVPAGESSVSERPDKALSAPVFQKAGQAPVRSAEPKKSDFVLPDKDLRNRKPNLDWRQNVEKQLNSSKKTDGSSVGSPSAPLQGARIAVSGSGTGSTGSGRSGAGEGISFTGAGQKMPEAVLAYVRELQELFRKNWDIPGDLRQRFSGLSCEIEISAGPAGEVTAARIVKSSKDSRFDRYAQEAIRKTRKLPKAPRELENQPLTLEFKP